MVARNAEGQIIGFVCGTASNEDKLTHESMFVHVYNGRNLNTHSVVVHPDLRRKGIALFMLQKYLQMQKEETQLENVFLLCKINLQTLYEKAGFTLVGPSAVHHGQEQWYEMRLRLKSVN